MEVEGQQTAKSLVGKVPKGKIGRQKLVTLEALSSTVSVEEVAVAEREWTDSQSWGLLLRSSTKSWSAPVSAADSC